MTVQELVRELNLLPPKLEVRIAGAEKPMKIIKVTVGEQVRRDGHVFRELALIV